MSTALDYYVQDEFVVNCRTGEAFASQSAAARMACIAESTLRGFVSSRKWMLKTAI